MTGIGGAAEAPTGLPARSVASMSVEITLISKQYITAAIHDVPHMLAVRSARDSLLNPLFLSDGYIDTLGSFLE
jgi:hypothetical protein